MGAYICASCDRMYCSHEVNFYYCEKCKTAMCEGCWETYMAENEIIDEPEGICGACYQDLLEEARLMTEPEVD